MSYKLISENKKTGFIQLYGGCETYDNAMAVVYYNIDIDQEMWPNQYQHFICEV